MPVQKHMFKKGGSFPVPEDLDVDERDFASAFVEVSKMIEASSESEDLLLYLSSCRNAYLTANSIFVDLRSAFGHGKADSVIELAKKEIQNGEHFTASRRVKLELSLPLAEVEAKFEVWGKRSRYLFYIEEYFSKDISPLDVSILKQVLFSPKQNTDFFDREEYLPLFELTEEEPEPLKALIHEFVDIGKAGSHLLELFWMFYNLELDRKQIARQRRLDFGEEDHQDQFDNPFDFKRAIELVGWIAGLLEITHVVAGETHAFSSEFQVGRAAISESISNLGSLADELGGLVEFINRELQLRLARAIESRPRDSLLPDPYIIDLIDRGRGIEGRSNYEISSIPLSAERLHRAKICIVSIGFHSEEVLRKSSPEYASREAREFVHQSVLNAVKLAVQKECSAIVFPECSIPKVAIPEIMDSIKGSQLIVIGGVEHLMDDNGGVYDNYGFVVGGGISNPSYFEKVTNSTYEAPLPINSRKVRIFTRSQLGTFGVVVCSDLLNGQLVTDIYSKQVDVCFVITLNKNPDLFECMAFSDAHRYWSNVCVSNMCVLAPGDFEEEDVVDRSSSLTGSVCVTPRREAKTSFVEADECVRISSNKNIGVIEGYFHQIEIEAIRSAKHRNYDKSYMSPHQSRF